MKQPLGELILKVIINITLMQGIVVIPDYSLTFNGASWYLSTLFICYLFVPFFIIKIRNINRNNLLIIGICFFQFIICSILPEISKYYMDILYISPFIRIMDVIMGMVLAKIYLERDTEKEINYNLWQSICIPLLGIAYMLSFILPGHFTRGLIYSPVFILGIYFVSFEKGFISNLLCNNILQKLATISFEFYMIHELIIKLYYKLFKNIFSDLGGGWLIENSIVAVVSFITAIIISSILNEYISKTYKKNKKNCCEIIY